jgi:hypothetical protein
MAQINNNSSSRTSVIVSLAAFKAARARASQPSASGGRRLLALRLRTPQQIEHRRRMLRHLGQHA